MADVGTGMEQPRSDGKRPPFALKLDAEQVVWLIRSEGGVEEMISLGQRELACEAMAGFLEQVDFEA